MSKISIQKVFSQMKDFRVPMDIGNINGCTIKLTKIQGSFPWHSHKKRDTMILVMKGIYKVYLEHQEIILEEGELCIIPRGIMHSATAEQEAWLLVVK